MLLTAANEDLLAAIDNTFVSCLILEYLEINWAFYEEIHKVLPHFDVNTCHNALQETHSTMWLIRDMDNYIVRPPPECSSIIVRKIGSGKTGYYAV